MPRVLHRVVTALALSVTLGTSVAAPLSAQSDTISGPKTGLFTWRDMVLFGAFITGTGLAAPLDKRIAHQLQDSAVQANRFLKDVADVVRTTAAPGSYAIGVGLYAVGRLTKNERAADLGLHGTEALVVGQLIGTVLKGSFGRARPYMNIDNPSDFAFGRGFKSGKRSDYQSFPSGHTISAFAAAAAVTSETGRWWPNSRWIIGPVLYGGAALAGASRMYNNKHWFSDVMAGAAIGTFAGLKVVRWHHTHPGNRIDRVLLSGTVTRSLTGDAMIQWSLSPDFSQR